MSYTVNNNVISLTRGDTFKSLVKIQNEDGSPYIAQPGDKIRFAMARTYNDVEPILVKTIDISDLLLQLNPEDTKTLDYGTYVYDIELTKESGEVDTFITKGNIKITEEVH